MRAITAVGLAAFTLCGATFVAPANAADLAYPPPPVFNEPDAQFEFGTGWYLRGDASFGPEDQVKLSPLGFDQKKNEWGYAAGGGIGYKFNSFLRADVTGDYFQPMSLSGTGVDPLTGNNILEKQRLQHYDGMANIYLDLGNWYGLTPYLGGGAGVGVLNPSGKIIATNPVTGDQTVIKESLRSQTNFAWAAMAGVSYQVDPNIAIDLGYRHIDLGHFATTLAGFAISKHVTQDEIRLGVRYMIY